MAINMDTWQSANALNTSLNQLANTIVSIKNNKDAEKAQKKELEFLEQQHADNVDFANRNLANNEKYAELNYGLQKDVFEYQKQLNTTQMEREDSAFRRQMNDLKLAGLSPLSAIGGNGAQTTSLSAANAPQYDMSGINQASGAYLDLAREYAALRNNMYSKNRELRQGASIAFAQMRNDLMTKGMSTATQLFNARVNAESQLVNNEYTREQKKRLEYENNWYEEHGYQNVSVATVISDFLNKGEVKKAVDKFADLLSQGLDAVANSATAIADSIKNYKGTTIQFTREENHEMIQDLSYTEFDFVREYSDKIKKPYYEWDLSDWLNCAEAERKYRKGK